MDTRHILMLIGAVTFVALAVLLLSGLAGPAMSGGDETVDIAYVESLQMGMDPGSIPELKTIIKGDSDSYTRERAVIALSDISAVNGDPEDAIAFLKEVAFSEEDEDVRVAAFANIERLRQQFPADIGGSLDVQAYSDFKPGSVIEFFVEIGSEEGSDDITVNLDNYWTVDEDGTFMGGLDVTPTKPYYLTLGPGERKIVPFNATVAEAGEYLVTFRVKMGQDRADYQILRQDIGLSISESGGSYSVLATD